jgi:hypothetical protein
MGETPLAKAWNNGLWWVAPDNVDSVDVDKVDFFGRRCLPKIAVRTASMKGAKKLIVVSTRVDEDVAAKLKQLADAKEWTVSKYVERLIRQHVQDEPKKPEKPAKGGKRS